ncbi:puromycin-sensitive aminopeptidase-like [Diaphorina citri]|uniref:Puromycin-sensitive aminopeptidase-like n=1 Tax=Diaphorina citri TaxID=121845 RepID=A0A3Q0J6P9_DIACI|nr:puromycin-sensitive aminopeptidase-like [Diaphorina citri]
MLEKKPFERLPKYTSWLTSGLAERGLRQFRRIPVDLLLSNTEYHHLFYQFGVQILKPAGQSLGWEPKANENHLNTLLRSLIISRLGVYGDPDTLTLARAKFEAHVKGTAILPADLRSPVYRAAIAGGSEATYQQLLKVSQGNEPVIHNYGHGGYGVTTAPGTSRYAVQLVTRDFRKGMHLYLTRHQYSNAFTEDLWAALEEASSKPIGRVMSTWTQQMGFPVISVDASVQNEDGSRTLTLSQTKFSADGSTDSTWLNRRDSALESTLAATGHLCVFNGGYLKESL